MRPPASVLAAALAAAAVTLAACGGDGSRDQARSFHQFRKYWLGESFAGDKLTRAGLKLEGRVGATSFIYGSCQPSSDAGCAPPTEVQNYPICSRNPARSGLVGRGRRYPRKYLDLPLERVPGGAVAFYRSTAGGIEVYIGRTTVVIFSNHLPMRFSDPDHLSATERRFVEGLRPVSGSHTGNLPPPAPGALAGRLRCGK